MQESVKLIVFVPEGAVDSVRLALAAAGAGRIGDYDHCCFVTHGTGHFRPLDSASPHIGRKGDIAEVAECRLETVVARERLPAVLEALRASHPYEEVAYDLIPLLNHHYNHLVPKNPR